MLRLRCRRWPRARTGRETGLGVGLARGPAGLDPEAIGREGAERAGGDDRRRQAGLARCPVVLDPTVAASFVGLIGGALGADAVQRGRSLFAERLGEEIAGEAFGWSTTASTPTGFATAPFDGEGVAAAAHGADRGRPPAHLPLRHLHGAPRRRRARPATAGAAAIARRRGVSASNLVVAPGEREPRRAARARPATASTSRRRRAALRRQPDLRRLLGGRDGTAIRGGELAEPRARGDDRVGPGVDAAAPSGGRRGGALGARSAAASGRRVADRRDDDRRRLSRVRRVRAASSLTPCPLLDCRRFSHRDGGGRDQAGVSRSTGADDRIAARRLPPTPSKPCSTRSGHAQAAAERSASPASASSTSPSAAPARASTRRPASGSRSRAARCPILRGLCAEAKVKG